MISKEKLRRVKVAWACVEHYLKNWQECSSGGGDDMRDLLQLPIGASNCPACWVYMFSWRAKHHCEGCPVSRYTGQSSCNGTPWYEMRDRLRLSLHGYGGDKRKYSKAADSVRREYAFLVRVALKESAELLK